MESQPPNPEFRINPENFHPCICTKASHKCPDVVFIMLINVKMPKFRAQLS